MLDFVRNLQVRRTFLHRFYSGLLALLMAFTTFGYVPGESYLDGDESQKSSSDHTTFQSVDHFSADNHALPFEGEDDLRAEEDETEDDDSTHTTDVFAGLSSEPHGAFNFSVSWNNATLVAGTRKQIPLFVRYLCWKLDLNV